jgi:hypothetical protein
MDDPGRSPDPPRRPPADGVFEPAAVTPDHPHLGRWAAVVAIVLVVVIVKPWALSGPAPTAGDEPEGGAAITQTSATSATPGSALDGARPSPGSSPTGSPDPAAAVDAFCLERGTWLVASVETWQDQTVRVWRALEPATSATGPDDPTIPVIRVASERVLQIGWCAPPGDGSASTDAEAATLDVWRRSETGTRPQLMVRSRPVGAASPLGAMYVAPRRPLGSRSAVWPEGTYVFRHRSADGQEHWFAIRVIEQAAVRATASSRRSAAS